MTASETDTAEANQSRGTTDESDTRWKQHTSFDHSRASTGPCHIATGESEANSTISKSYVEIRPTPEGSNDVELQTHVEGTYMGNEFDQGEIMTLTPAQAREFAAALIEQADHVDSGGEQ